MVLAPLIGPQEDATITDTVLDETDQPLMADRVEEPGLCRRPQTSSPSPW
jgi:hypothetical protein